MDSNTVVIFGAGATKACGGPLTNEILTRAFNTAYEIDREQFLPTLEEFLSDNFYAAQSGELPPLPLLISFLDTAIDRGHALGPKWDQGRLIDARRALDYVIFAVLEHDLKKLQKNYYHTLYDKLKKKAGTLPVTISLNYDIIADNALTRINEASGNDEGIFPDYLCDVASDLYRKKMGDSKLLKLHGSLNWLYCPSCNRLDVGISNSGVGFTKVLEQLYSEEKAKHETLEQRLTCQGRKCISCHSEVKPVMISPTYFKDYRNPHISRIWYEADQVLRKAKRVIIIGYSLPDDDLDVLYLLKRGLSHLGDNSIDIVEFDSDHRLAEKHPVGRRYVTLFGKRINWHTDGFEGFLDRFPIS